MLAWPCLVVAVCGLVLRICAFFTAKSNFTHLVSFEKVDKHRLVTHGVYAMFRHPSYTGFYYYAVFGQIFVGNWVSAVLTASTLTRFFTDRIEAE